jgi:hypothetical protein
MITLILERHREGEMLSRYRREEPPHAALSFLVQSELAFAAGVVELKPQRIHLETRLADLLDVTYVTGSESDMRSLVELVAIYQLAASEREDLVNSGAASHYSSLIERNPAYSGVILDMGAPILVGQSRLRIAVMLSLGYREEADLRLAASLSLSDLMTLTGMLAEYPSMSFRQLGEELGFSAVT